MLYLLVKQDDDLQLYNVVDKFLATINLVNKCFILEIENKTLKLFYTEHKLHENLIFQDQNYLKT